MSKYNILAIIPARGGSKRIPRKNVLPLVGKPLIAHSILHAQASKLVDKIVVSSDDDEILSIAKTYGATALKRPQELASDTSPVLLTIQQVIDDLEKNEEYKADIIVLLQATSPLRKAEDIDKCIQALTDSGADSSETFTPVKEHPAAMFRIDQEGNAEPIEPENLTKRSQDLAQLFVENGAVYVFTREQLARNSIYGEKHKGVIMPKERSIDIDEDFDFKIAELLLEDRT